MISASGRPVANQFKVWTDGAVFFQSYNSTIAKRDFANDRVTLYNPYWDFYSATTNRYLLQFLNEDSVTDIRAKVESGEYQTA
jgi:hypothetical protein